MTASCLYVGSVTHRRLRPRRHKLRVRVFWMLLDVDEVDALSRRSRLFSLGRFNAASFHIADHGDGSPASLRIQVERHLGKAGIDLAGGAIRLLCMPRIFGYGFNPLSVYFCYRHDGALAAILYEVHNTFGERHSYLFTVDGNETLVSHRCAKNFHVSPFMGMTMHYEFRVLAPNEKIAVAIRCSDADELVLSASLAGQRRPFTDRWLAYLLLTHPLLTLKVIAGIHWHALRLWWKGVPLAPHPAAPSHPVSIVQEKFH